jgi:ABC-type amino acid transport substrate-binding protein
VKQASLADEEAARQKSAADAKSNKAGLKVSPVWDVRDVGINTRLGDTALLGEINKHLATMQADGFLKSVDTKWLGVPTHQVPSSR